MLAKLPDNKNFNLIKSVPRGTSPLDYKKIARENFKAEHFYIIKDETINQNYVADGHEFTLEEIKAAGFVLITITSTN